MKGLARGLTVPIGGLRPHGQRGRHLRAGASRRAEPRLHLGRVPRALRGELRPDRGQAVNVAAGVTCAAVVWLTLILTSPVALSRGRLPALTLAVYQAGSLVCHQRPERSFHLAGVQLPVCARCFGLYLSGAAGLTVASRSRRALSARAARTLLALAAAADRDDRRARVAGYDPDVERSTDADGIPPGVCRRRRDRPIAVVPAPRRARPRRDGCAMIVG